MPDAETPQIYLLTPPDFELSTFPDMLARVLDDCDVACVRLALAGHDEDRLSRAGDAVREVCHARDVAIVIDSHVALAERLGLDGVHLLDGARSVRSVRKTLGADAIVGAFCGVSKHDGMSAGEAGADYVSFGPAGASTLGDGTQADKDLFAWWSEMMLVPVVAEGALTVDVVTELASVTDFFAVGEEIWRTEDPATALRSLIDAMG